MRVQSRRILLLLFVLFAANVALSQPVVYKFDMRHSIVGFSVKVAGGLSEVEGAFPEFSGEMRYDGKDLTKADFKISITVDKINTGNAGRDEHLRSDDFFSVATYPTITFQGTNVEHQGAQYLLRGTLTMKGISKIVEIPFRKRHDAPLVWIFGTPTVILEGELALNRKDYGIQANARWNRLVAATGELAMSNEVAIRLKIIAEGTRVDAVVLNAITTNGLDNGVKAFNELKKKLAGSDAIDENTLNIVAYRLLEQKKVEDAITVFNLNVQEYPNSSNVHESLGEAYEVSGNKKLAREYYQKSLALDPGNEVAKKKLAELDK
ncbi:MAG TPA: YceI family protein [Bacteroidota bacterium]